MADRPIDDWKSSVVRQLLRAWVEMVSPQKLRSWFDYAANELARRAVEDGLKHEL